MNQIPDILYQDEELRKTWVIVGASRGIGLEFVRQLLLREDRIVATVRDLQAFHAYALWGQVGSDHGRCQMFYCDVLSEASINARASMSKVRNKSSPETGFRVSPCCYPEFQDRLRYNKRWSSQIS